MSCPSRPNFKIYVNTGPSVKVQGHFERSRPSENAVFGPDRVCICKAAERVVTSDKVGKTDVMNKIDRDNAFSSRLKKVFEFATMAEVGKRLNVPHATVRNYYNGRLPAPDILIKIANETGVSLTWLLTGKGDMFVTGRGTKNIGQALEELINEIVDRRLAEIEKNKRRSTNKNIPAFDIDVSVGRFNDPKVILTEWYEFDGEKPPKDFSVVFFRGWETFTSEEKVEAIRDARRVLDRAKKVKKK
ncbi:MAG: helix-turn-helix domain-containing protein [Acidobacteria bacterium ACB1]|nr:helix-turn-helix domain-containing protein [Acidobacteria bacterium ACB1]